MPGLVQASFATASGIRPHIEGSPITRQAILPLFALLLAATAMPVTASTGSDGNEAVVRRLLLERMGQGRFEISGEIYGPGFVAHGFGRDFTLAEDEASGRALRAAFPDLEVRIDRLVSEGDLLAVHWSATGTNASPARVFRAMAAASRSTE